MAREGWREVSEEEFHAFLLTYPAPLEHDCTGICEPPLHNWNDFRDGKMWPESMVATMVESKGYPGIPDYVRYEVKDG